MQIYFICLIFIKIFYTWFSTYFLSQAVHCLSAEIWSLSAHPILSLPRNHTFTIKTSLSYLKKSLWTSKLLISALKIHRHFVAFNCLPFCLLFSKPILTISFGKYQLSNCIIKFIFRSGNHPHNQWNRRSRLRHCLHVFCGLYLGYPTESTNVVNSSHSHTCEPSRIIRKPPGNAARLPHSREWDRTSWMWKY